MRKIIRESKKKQKVVKEVIKAKTSIEVNHKEKD
jgi:hypothetical protein